MKTRTLGKVRRATAAVGLAFAISGLALLTTKLGIGMPNYYNKKDLINNYRLELVNRATTDEEKQIIINLSDEAIYELAQNSTDGVVRGVVSEIDHKTNVENGLTYGYLSALVAMNGCLAGSMIAGDRLRKRKKEQEQQTEWLVIFDDLEPGQ